MYRVSPFTYLVSGILSTSLTNVPVECSEVELLRFEPLPEQTCDTYMSEYIQTAGGYVANPEATSSCEYCPLSNTDAFLKLVHNEYSERWRNFGILWVYVLVNIIGALLFYWLVRVPKKTKKSQIKSGEVVAPVQGPGEVEDKEPEVTVNSRENREPSPSGEKSSSGHDHSQA